MSISKILIENVRGFENETLDVDVRPNFVNIMVAANGFGKTSISTAFMCASAKIWNITENDKHKKQKNVEASLKIEYRNQWLEANKEKNSIAENFDIFPIKSGIEPKAKMPRINGFPVPRPYLEIPNLDLGPAMTKAELQYDIKKYQSIYAENSKVVRSILLTCENRTAHGKLLDSFSAIGKLNQKKSLDFFNTVNAYIASVGGTKAAISKRTEEKFGLELSSLGHVNEIFEIIRKYNVQNSWLDNLLTCYQLMDLHQNDRKSLKKWLEYSVYCSRLQSIKDFIKDINCAWVSASVKEVNNRVIVNFPDAASLSNGQRDLLYFACNLLRARETSSRKNCIVIIDEVFDYLDDANIIVAQYFLSKMINFYREEGREIYVMLLTHLDPSYFKGYALSKQKTNYLGASSHKVTQTMKKVISDRENPIWKDHISKYFLHYHPDNYDISEIFNTEFGLPKRHGRSHEFYEFLRTEWEKYISGNEIYDPFAVCAFVRVQIERCAFEKIEDQDQKRIFLDESNGTPRKLEFLESIGITAPESCLLLGVVYNEALHKKGDIDQASSIILKLKNLSLQTIMKNSISW